MNEQQHHEQGSFEWYYDRFGMITMSDRVDILINGNVHALNNLIDTIRWEQSIKADVDHVRREWERETRLGDVVEALQWGKENEARAIAHYEMTHNIDVIRPPFKRHPMFPRIIGASTDFLIVDQDGKVLYAGEVKCYRDQGNHLKALRYGMDAKHYNQVQGNIECWNAERGKFLSFDPRIPIVDQQLYIQNVERDRDWHYRLVARANEFINHLDNGTRFDFQMSGARDGIPSLF